MEALVWEPGNVDEVGDVHGQPHTACHRDE
jgi:hypothetical protein